MSGTRHRILVMDDELPIRFAMKSYFEAVGYDVDDASGLDEAIRLIGEHRYSAAFLDLRLGGSGDTGGLEAVRRLRTAQPEALILVLTAYGSAENEAEARQLGADRVLHKPQALPDVARTLAELLEERRASA